MYFFKDIFCPGTTTIMCVLTCLIFSYSFSLENEFTKTLRLSTEQLETDHRFIYLEGRETHKNLGPLRNVLGS